MMSFGWEWPSFIQKQKWGHDTCGTKLSCLIPCSFSNSHQTPTASVAQWRKMATVNPGGLGRRIPESAITDHRDSGEKMFLLIHVFGEPCLLSVLSPHISLPSLHLTAIDQETKALGYSQPSRFPPAAGLLLLKCPLRLASACSRGWWWVNRCPIMGVPPASHSNENFPLWGNF